MVERRPGVMPPKPGPPPRQVPPGAHHAPPRSPQSPASVIVVVVVFALVKVARQRLGVDHRRRRTIVASPKPFRIVFPEGFSRAEMAQRVQAVALIAQHKRHNKKVRLSQRARTCSSRIRAALAGFGAKKRSLEGFLFPATYDFLAGTTSAQLVQQQLDAFAEQLEQGRSRRTRARRTSRPTTC